ncbi:MAG: M18 family aminopeptidase [Defluviitaleaceae bacterium]|nr:M18 family aminopeptidase [Defluviitaleaceae bacterium]
MNNSSVQKLLDFLYESPTAHHAVHNSAAQLKAAGFTELFEKDVWDITPGGKYFVTKNGTCFAAFVAGTDVQNPAIRIIAGHTDSPTFVIKPNPQMITKGHIKLNTAAYGGPIMHTWFDRPLSLAGRVLLKSNSFLVPKQCLININKPLVIIPSLAIHMNREVNKGFEINAQNHTLPLVAMVNEQLENNDYLVNLLTKELGCEASDILDFDLMLYEYAKGEFVGSQGEFISSSRLDDLWMVYSGLQALLQASAGTFTKLIFAPDNEEIGSLTTQGAQSRFISSIIERIVPEGAFDRALAQTFVISCDLAHGAHPNFPEKDDPTTATMLGGGAVLKYSANKKYATTDYTAAVFKALCERAGVPCQGYITRSDVQGGSTIGAMMGANLGVAVVDMGLAVLGMHSIRELGATADHDYALKLFNTFFDNEVN